MAAASHRVVLSSSSSSLATAAAASSTFLCGSTRIRSRFVAATASTNLQFTSSRCSDSRTATTRASGTREKKPFSGVALASSSASNQDDNNGNKKPRTGWLHSTVPRAVREAASQQPSTTSKARKLLQMQQLKKLRDHRIVAPPTFHACGDGRVAAVTEHVVTVPVYRPGFSLGEDTPSASGDLVEYYDKRGGVQVYFSVVELVTSPDVRNSMENIWQSSSSFSQKEEQAAAATRFVQSHAKMANASSMLLYLQGGPGFGAPTPVAGIGLGEKSSWVGQALSTKGITRVVLMDQRGTGRSTPITKQTLEQKFPDLFLADETHKDGDELPSLVEAALKEATEYMASFRADNIIRDAEVIREVLLLPQDEEEEVPRPWGAALGQSFGGFCLMTYLSWIPHPPRVCLFTGGIAPMLADTPTDVYRQLWKRVYKRNLRYYQEYPQDVQAVQKIVRLLSSPTSPQYLPSGVPLTARRFLQLGIVMGSSPSSFACLHEMVSTALVQDHDETLGLSRGFLRSMESTQPYDDNPIYFLLHESIYANGPENSPTAWAAHQALQEKEQEKFHPVEISSLSENSPTLFYGEMIFPWMASGDYGELKGVAMKRLAEALAHKSDWTHLYNPAHIQQVLSDVGGTVQGAAAAVYYEDMYVEFAESIKVLDSCMSKCKVWITNEFQHSGLRDDGARIFAKLWEMVQGSDRTPS